MTIQFIRNEYLSLSPVNATSNGNLMESWYYLRDGRKVTTRGY